MEGQYKMETEIQSLNVQIGSFWFRVKCNGELMCTRQYSSILGFQERMKLSSLLKIMFHGVRQVINSNN